MEERVKSGEMPSSAILKVLSISFAGLQVLIEHARRRRCVIWNVKARGWCGSQISKRDSG